MRDNKDVFSTVEFRRWAERFSLHADEHFVISRYLRRTAKTLEGGTGAGRILLAMKDMGFTSLYGFDFVPEFIAQARARDTDNAIRFEVQDATRLSYDDASFDQIVYLQQLLCFMEDADQRRAALNEAFRVLRPGGTALFSVLSYEARLNSRLGFWFVQYLRLLRWLTRPNRSEQALPWMRLGGRFNPGCLLDRGPYVYWFKLREIADLLRAAGFQFRAVASVRQIRAGQMAASPEALPEPSLGGTLYCVCTK